MSIKPTGRKRILRRASKLSDQLGGIERPAKEKFVRLGRARYFERHKILPEVIDVADEMGIKVHPTAQRYVKSVLVRGAKAGRLGSAAETEQAGIVLVAAGIEAAKEKGRMMVTVKDLKTGFDQLVRSGAGNCAPHLCLQRSILRRDLGDLKAKIPDLETLTQAVKRRR